VDISRAEDPVSALFKAIAKHNIEDAVVRLIYKLRSDQLDLIDNASIHQALSAAHTYTIQPELVSQLARPRLPELNASSSIDPMEALKTYLSTREDLKDIAASMLEAANKLLVEDVDVWEEKATDEQDSQNSLLVNKNIQLPLL
jgi:DNA repair protein SbcD/Mre11